MDRAGSILIVDDDPNICKSLAAILGKKGYRTETARSGAQALTKAKQQPFTVALLDIRLSDMQGVELIGRLKEQHTDMAVIMVTAHGSVETAIRAINEGASGYVLKPFGIDEVLTSVEQALEKRRLVIENRELYEAARQELAERERAEQDLRKSQERYRALFNSGYDAVFVHRVTEDGKPGPFTEVNDVACRRLGYAREELLKLSPSDIDATQGATDSETVMERLMADGHCLFGQLHVTRDGRTIPVEINAHLFELGGETRVLSIARDVTERRRVEDALRESEERYRELVQHQGEGIGLVDQYERFTFVNPAAEKVFGVQPGELTGRSLALFVDKETWAVIRSQTEIRRRGEVSTYDVEIIRPDGEKRQLVLTATPRYDEDDAFAGTFGVFRDITERKQAELALEASVRFLRIANRHTRMDALLREALQELKNVTKCAAVGIRILGRGGEIPYQAYDGFPQDFYEEESPLSIRSDSCMCVNVIKGEIDPTKPFYTEGGSFYMNGTTRFLATVPDEEKGKTRNACNRFGYESVALVPIRLADSLMGLIHVADPQEHMVPQWMVKILEQVGLQLGTAIRRVSAQEQLSHTATHDPLTDLPNRQLLAELFISERARARRSGKRIVLMYLDLDRFKDVNDTLGHSIGDSLLRAVAGRLRGVPRLADTVARMGGDEFVLTVAGIRGVRDAARVAERVMEAVRKPYELGGVTAHITTSLGIAFYPEDGEELDALLRAADTAMYRAKDQGRDGFQVYRADPTLEIDGLQTSTPASGSGEQQVHNQPDPKQTGDPDGSGD